MTTAKSKKTGQAAVTPSITELARRHGALALSTLVDVAENGGTDASRVSAANALLERGFGKVGQPLELAGPDGEALKVEHSINPALAEALAALQC